MSAPAKRHVRVFRIRPGKWSYLITGSEPHLPLHGTTRTYESALRRGVAWLTVPAVWEW